MFILSKFHKELYDKATEEYKNFMENDIALLGRKGILDRFHEIIVKCDIAELLGVVDISEEFEEQLLQMEKPVEYLYNIYLNSDYNISDELCCLIKSQDVVNN